jgi:hypothetical protein
VLRGRADGHRRYEESDAEEEAGEDESEDEEEEDEEDEEEVVEKGEKDGMCHFLARFSNSPMLTAPSSFVEYIKTKLMLLL